MFLEDFAKCPDGASIGYVAREFKPKETHKRKPIRDLILEALVRQVVQPLQNQQLEHEDAAGGFAPGRALAVFDINASKNGTENLPVNNSIQPLQRVSRFA